MDTRLAIASTAMSAQNGPSPLLGSKPSENAVAILRPIATTATMLTPNASMGRSIHMSERTSSLCPLLRIMSAILALAPSEDCHDADWRTGSDIGEVRS